MTLMLIVAVAGADIFTDSDWVITLLAAFLIVGAFGAGLGWLGSVLYRRQRRR